MQYMLLLYHEETGWDRLTPEEQEEGVKACHTFVDQLLAAGALVGSNRLRPSKQTKRVRVGSGKRKVLDGPFAETKEHLGGYYLIEVPDEAAAVEWAEKCPGAQYGTVEVRPVWV